MPPSIAETLYIDALASSAEPPQELVEVVAPESRMRFGRGPEMLVDAKVNEDPAALEPDAATPG
jgi:hypothetical protein